MEAILASIVAAAAPLVYAAVGETITERAGVVNLSVNGSMLFAGMAGFAGAYTTGSVVVGFLTAAVVGALVAGIVVWSSISLKLDQIAVGFVLTLLAADLADFLGADFVRLPGPSVTPWKVPLLGDIPWVGPVLFDHNWSVYGSLLLVVAAGLFLERSRYGLALRAVGERPEAAHARGIGVWRTQTWATLVGGALVGIGGAAFTLDVKLGWSDGHIDGFGWIALAIVIFGGWRPGRVLLGCWLFGALQVVALRLQPVFPGVAQILPSLPFPLMIGTLVVLNTAWLQGLADRHPRLRTFVRSDAPSALGVGFQPD